MKQETDLVRDLVILSVGLFGLIEARVSNLSVVRLACLNSVAVCPSFWPTAYTSSPCRVGKEGVFFFHAHIRDAAPLLNNYP